MFLLTLTHQYQNRNILHDHEMGQISKFFFLKEEVDEVYEHFKGCKSHFNTTHLNREKKRKKEMKNSKCETRCQHNSFFLNNIH